MFIKLAMLYNHGLNLRSVYIFPVIKQVKYFLLALIIIIAGCSLEKKNGFNRSLQNLTAHYNILFNANELLKQKQETYALSFIDNYDGLLSVYPDTIARTNTPDKDLAAAITKANTIISEKEQSKYIGDAYLVLGKANYLGGNYFNAAEFFSYVIRSFPTQVNLKREASAWEVRSLLYLNNLQEAKVVIDTTFKNISPKKITADVYAVQLQYNIKTQNYTAAEEMAKQAIAYCKNKKQKLRWIFILAQLQELNQKNTDAILNYTRIVKSNAPFEMAFNANLNRIRIEDMRNGVKLNRINGLLALLKEPNNKDFKDQIYYQIGELYRGNNDINNALKYYRLSLVNSLQNQNQKGLSYLRIADIDFKYKADYVSAKKYYDSTLTNLSPNYPGYQLIQKKGNNLQLLVDRLNIIAHEDTLQMLARLDDNTRSARIDAMVANEILQQRAAANAIAAANTVNNYQNQQAVQSGGNTFYFNNVAAVSQGYNDFKRRWGNRKLEDNWRRSNRSGSSIATAPIIPTTVPNGAPDVLGTGAGVNNQVVAAIYRRELLKDLPLTPTLLQQSNTRIYNAYLDIANFYRDILEDKKEAIAGYLLLLNKFPDDPNKASIYYSLYRLYSETDAAISTQYKNRLLKEYPQSVFAKVIIDPDYSKKLDDNDALLNTAYNQVYDLYSQKKYPQVIAAVDELLKQYPGNRLLAQLKYLRVIAAGHQESLAPFRAELQQIALSYPDDRLITPLVKQHLAYVDANTAELAAQPYALMDNDATGVPFTPPIVYQQQTVYNRDRRINNIESEKTAAAPQQPQAKPSVTGDIVKIPGPITVNTPAKAAPSLFSTRDSTSYYFVINVSTGTTDLSSSRFGIGQFNRANFQANTIKHALKNAGPDNQLIYTGRFYSLGAVKDYAKAIIPLLPQIMKVPQDKYSFFIITQENLDKLANKKLLDSYIDYYQKTY